MLPVFLDLLTFFGTFLIAGMLIPKFAPDKAYHGQFFAGVLVLALAFEIFAFKIPFRSAWLELLYVLIGTAVLAAVLCTIVVVEGKSSQPPCREMGCLFVLLIPFFPIVSFTMLGRVHHAQKLAERIDGIVWLKYRSSNHNIRSIAVHQADGSILKIEGVDEEIWNEPSLEKSRLKKVEWSAKGQLDGKDVRIVPKAYVIFFGPFED